jgi:peptidoglycan/LPS O-acetylase OafA/YrhL
MSIAQAAGVESNHAPRNAVEYRGDIDGLRAIAVLSVILFHSGIPFVTGGFAGVDVFFVISGYLITGGILRDLGRGNFSILGFYERRVRRIYPALLVVLAVVLAGGVAILMPDELKDLGAEVVASVAFFSNLLFWWQTDYFAAAAELKPLLHTWSLAVEEQFYLVIAPLMALVVRLDAARTAWWLIALFVASFAASCLAAFVDPPGNYYLPQNRAWELLMGSLVALRIIPVALGRTAREICAAVALGMLLLPMLLLDRESTFPAWNALPTCLGTAAIIALGEQNRTAAAKVLSWEPLRWIGLISYSLYLVHWPILVFARYQLLRDPIPIEMIGLIATMGASAWLSWRFVELPFRRRRMARKRLFTQAALASAVVGLMGGAVFALGGLPQRLGAQATVLQPDIAQQEHTKGCFLKNSWREWPGDRCFLTHGRGRVILLWGDSHANHYASALRVDGARYDSKVLLYSSAGCPPVIGIKVKGRPDCGSNNDHALSVIAQFGVSKVVLSAAWKYDFDRSQQGLEKLAATVRLLHKRGIEVAIVGDSPAYPFSNPQYLGLRLARRENHQEPFYAATKNDFSINRKLARGTAPDIFFDPLELLCRQERCLAYQDGKLTMNDNGHFSTYGARLVVSHMGNVFR